MRSLNVNDTDIKKAYAKIHAGKATYEQAAAAIGLTANQLRWQVQRRGLSRGNSRTFRSSVEREARLKAAHTAIINGQSFEMAARDYGVTKTQLWKLLHRYGYYDNGTIRQQKTAKGNARTKFTPERVKRIYELYYNRGYVLKMACAECDVSMATYWNWRKAGLLGKWEVKVKRGDDDYRRMYARYLDDKTLSPADIAKQYGVCYNHLLKRWSELGLRVQWERRNEKIAQKARTELSSVELNDLWKKYASGAGNSNEIATYAHITWRRLKELFREAGYPVDKLVRERTTRRNTDARTDSEADSI